MVKIARVGNKRCFFRAASNCKKQLAPYGQVWPGNAANGYAISQVGKPPWNDIFAWYNLLHKKWGTPLIQNYSSPNAMVVLPAEADKALINARSISLDLKARIRNIEWELNRVHLPMVEDLRASVNNLDKYLRDLPATAAAGPDAMDKARLAAYHAVGYLDQMKTWLATMTDKIKNKQAADAAGLAKIAADKQAAAVKADQAGNTQAAAEQQKTAQLVYAQAVDAAKTANQAAVVTQKIEKPDKAVETKGQAVVWLGAAAAAVYLLM